MNRSRQILVGGFLIILLCLLACSCKASGQAEQKNLLESLVSIKKGYIEPVDAPFGASLSEVLAKPGFADAEYDAEKDRLIDYFEHPMLSEPAVRIIGFYQDEVYSVHVIIFNQKDYAAFKEELQREAEELLPKEWLESGDYFIIKGNASTSWSDPVKNQLDISTVKEEYLNLEEDNVMADIIIRRVVPGATGPMINRIQNGS